VGHRIPTSRVHHILCRRYLVTITSTSTSIIKYHYKQIYNFSTWHSPTHMNNVGRDERKEGLWFMFQKEREREPFPIILCTKFKPTSHQSIGVPRALPTPNSSIIGTSISTSWVWITYCNP
jgi:hypothetical protein